ncbi:uncharacterized protein An02g02180 [Aspergillus niger]|uniref:RING-type E3 ubiquitin transferase n=2 Tax=Aspergillus niger TaxID=5061 RepID=A2QC39_ASPNC|nr:uncharacterized protein An02g02180 [Aspergillus niger]CAK96392.1 unnamed protein product [Aspergillus niger]
MADVGDRMFCHACGGVWLREAHGMICPHCESDFTEIIEIPPDPDAEPPPSFHRPPSPPAADNARSPNPWADHNPWAHQEEDDDIDHGWGPGHGNGFTHRTYRSPDGRFTFSTTTYTHGLRGGSPPTQQRQANPDPLMPMVQGLDSIFHGLASTYRQQNRPGGQAQAPGSDRDRGRTLGSFAFDIEAEGRTGTQAGGLHPRDADGAADDVTARCRANEYQYFGAVPLGFRYKYTGRRHWRRAVYSQEELDRVISQLMEQNANRGAPPPAPPSAIQSLPKKKVDEEMLGSEGRAECSICMDAVELGTEVTVLPCSHWFHYSCIELWLNQHNTCPHCRRSIDAPQSESANSPPGNRPAAEGTSGNPVVIPDSPERERSQPSAARDAASPSGWSSQLRGPRATTTTPE